MNSELLILLGLAVIFGPPSFWAFHVLHKRSLARWAAEQSDVRSVRPQPPHRPRGPQQHQRSQVMPVRQQPRTVGIATRTETKPAKPQIQQEHETLACSDMLRQLDQAVHVMIVGPTNAGKTTAARALLMRRVQKGERLLIIDPHATSTTWGGLDALGSGRDYTAITPIFEALLEELNQRYVALGTDVEATLTPLTIVIDEWPSIQAQCGKIAGTFITQVAQEGRKAQMRLVILAQSDRVESLGIHGKGDVRTNFTTLLLGLKAQECLAEAAQLPWPAVLKEPEPKLVDTTGLPRMADIQFEPSSLWQTAEPEPPSAETADPLLQKILEEAAEPAPSEEETSADAQQLPQDELSVMLRTLLQAGFTRTAIVNHFRFASNRSAAFRRIREATGEEQTRSEAA